MKVAMIHGQNHQGSTYHVGRMLADKLDAEVTEFFLPRDFDQFCTGCTACFMKDEALCPHHEKIAPLTQAIHLADVIILTSPVYVYHVTGSMKAWLDHYGYQWMVHRPDETMFTKQAVCIATAAGAGTKWTNKDMADSFYYWGVGKIYKYGVNVRATSYQKVSQKTKDAIDVHTTKLARQIKQRMGKVKPTYKTRAFFQIMKRVHKRGESPDAKYWAKQGWTGDVYPW